MNKWMLSIAISLMSVATAWAVTYDKITINGSTVLGDPNGTATDDATFHSDSPYDPPTSTDRGYAGTVAHDDAGGDIFLEDEAGILAYSPGVHYGYTDGENQSGNGRGRTTDDVEHNIRRSCAARWESCVKRAGNSLEVDPNVITCKNRCSDSQGYARCGEGKCEDYCSVAYGGANINASGDPCDL